MDAAKYNELTKKFFEFTTGQKMEEDEDLTDALDYIHFSSHLAAEEGELSMRFTNDEDSVEIIATGANMEAVVIDMERQLGV